MVKTRNYSERLAISPETKELLDQARIDYINHHPEIKNLKITYNYMVNKLASIYLKM